MDIDFSASHKCAGRGGGSPTGKKLSAADISRPYCLVVYLFLFLLSSLSLYKESLSSITEMRFLFIESAAIKNNKM